MAAEAVGASDVANYLLEQALKKGFGLIMPAIFDLHCDTLTRNSYPPYEGTENTLNNPDFQLALGRIPNGTKWVQCFAIFIPDKLRGQDAIDFFDRYAASFHRQAEANSDRFAACRSGQELESAVAGGKTAGILTVEGGAVLAGCLDRVQAIRDAGVRMMTLTWNGPNELASGHDTQDGFSAFGREAVAEMERLGVLVDVSHLNDRGFEELLGFARKPFVASHSNARAVCGHKRNLPDECIQEMVRRDGLIGLNYCNVFISDDACGSMDQLYGHVCRFLELGAEKCLALGSDYDGAGMHEDLDRAEKCLNIHSYLTRHGISQDTADDICFGNAWRFFQKWMG